MNIVEIAVRQDLSTKLPLFQLILFYFSTYFTQIAATTNDMVILSTF